MAVDLETGALADRWALDEAQDAGLVSRPSMAVDGDQIVLARNRDRGRPRPPRGSGQAARPRPATKAA